MCKAFQWEGMPCKSLGSASSRLQALGEPAPLGGEPPRFLSWDFSLSAASRRGPRPSEGISPQQSHQVLTFLLGSFENIRTASPVCGQHVVQVSPPTSHLDRRPSSSLASWLPFPPLNASIHFTQSLVSPFIHPSSTEALPCASVHYGPSLPAGSNPDALAWPSRAFRIPPPPFPQHLLHPGIQSPCP